MQQIQGAGDVGQVAVPLLLPQSVVPDRGASLAIHPPPSPVVSGAGSDVLGDNLLASSTSFSRKPSGAHLGGPAHWALPAPGCVSHALSSAPVLRRLFPSKARRLCSFSAPSSPSMAKLARDSAVRPLPPPPVLSSPSLFVPLLVSCIPYSTDDSLCTSFPSWIHFHTPHPCVPDPPTHTHARVPTRTHAHRDPGTHVLARTCTHTALNPGLGLF